MEFLGVGYQELLLVLVLMLVVVGPDRLPQVAYQIGRAVRQMQRYARAVRDEFGDEFSYIEEQYRVVRGEVDVARTEFRRQQQEFNADVQATAREIESAVPGELTGRTSLTPLAAPASVPDTSSASDADTSAAPGAAADQAASSGAKPPLLF